MLRSQPAASVLHRLRVRRGVAAASAVADAQDDPVSLVRVCFSVRVQVGYGDSVAVVGSHAALGEWDVARAVPLTWSTDGDGASVWTGEALVPEHFILRFKCLVLRADGSLQWAPGCDTTTLASADAALDANSRLDVFRLNASLPFGHAWLLCGSPPSLGGWNPAEAVQLKWSDADVWETSLSLETDRGGPPAEFKLLHRTSDGSVTWMSGQNEVLPALGVAHAASFAAGRPVSRHLHRQRLEWWQPWYWAPELGHADVLVSLPGAAPASAADSPERLRAGAADAAALAYARTEGAVDSLAPLAAAGPLVAGLAAAKGVSAQAAAELRSALQTAGAVGAAVATAGAVGIAGGGDVALASAAAVPIAEAAALGMLVAFGAKNLLYAEDRARFLEATGSRKKLLKLIRQNMQAVGVGGNAQVAASVAQTAAEAGFVFDPLSLLTDAEEEDEGGEEEEETNG